MPPATWQACRIITCWAPSPMARWPASMRRTFAGKIDLPGYDPVTSTRAGARAGADKAQTTAFRRTSSNTSPALRKRLPAAAQGHGQDEDRSGALRRSPRRRRQRHGGPRRARTDAVAGSRPPFWTAPTWRRTLRCSAPRAAGASIITASTIQKRTTTNGSATAILRKQNGQMIAEKRPVAPYIVPIEDPRRSAYDSAAHPPTRLNYGQEHADRSHAHHRSGRLSMKPNASPTRDAPSASTYAHSTYSGSVISREKPT